MKNIINNQKGAIIVIFALTLIVLIGFAALGTEVGKWYLTRAELSKAVDAAALAGAANISNPNIDVPTLARDFGIENFRAGYLGTETGVDETGKDKSVAFTATVQEGGKLTVTGRTSSFAILARFFGVDQVAVAATGVAQKNKVEIMMVLDRSGSMDGNPIRDLKEAAQGFLEYYKDTQDEDRIGLVSFATGVSFRALANNFYTPITNSINSMSATGATNAEDAIAQAGAAFVDQTGVAPANRIQQYIIFFTDGRPTAFRSMFTRNGSINDAVVCVTGNCDRDSDSMYSQMGHYNNETWYNTSTLSPGPTGDGKPTSGNPRTVCKNGSTRYENTKWGSFSAYPLSGYGAEDCDINNVYDSGDNRRPLDGKNGYICKTARQMAIDHASAAKAKLVKIYAIGLGNVDESFLNAVASTTNDSSSDYVYITPDSNELKSIFNKIAKDIKLRLVQ